MNKYLRYTRFYLGLFAIIGLLSAILFFILSYILGSNDDTGMYSLLAGSFMLTVSILLITGVVAIRNNRKLGCLLIQIGASIFICGATYAIYNFTLIFSGWKAVLVPLTIWVPLCTPFAIVIFYIWPWSRQ